MNAITLPQNQTISLTQFPDQSAQTKTDLNWSTQQLEAFICSPPHYASKKACGWVKLATFGENRSPKNCLRHDANVTSVTGAEGDYDDKELSIEEATRILQANNVKCYLYTSAGYTQANPKWRAIIPFSVAYSGTKDEMKAHRKQMVARIDNLLGYVFAAESYTLSQSFYIGQVNGVEYKSFLLDGDNVDQREDLAVDIKAKNKAGAAGGGYGDDFDINAVAELIYSGRNYHQSTCRLAAHYIGKGMSQQDAVAAIEFTYSVSPIKNTCDKWQDRFDSIPELVESAFAKYGEEAAKRKAARDPNIAMAGNAQLIRLGTFQVEFVGHPDNIAAVLMGQPDMQNLCLINYKDTLYKFTGSGYEQLPSKWLHKKATLILPKCYHQEEEDRHPTKGTASVANANNVANYVMSTLHSDYIDTQSPPFYVRGKVLPNQCDAEQLIVFRNGSLNINNGEFYKPDPNLFALNVLPYDYEPGAGVPVRWLQFLDEVWPDDKSSHDLLQEIFGYLLSGETKLQKLFMFIGATRGGKGIIGGVIKAMIGEQNMCGQTLDGLTSTFGMQSMLDKKVWIMADARVGKTTDQAIAVERLLSITGGDSIEVRRMYIPAATQTLCVRPIIMANMMPKLYETSGALVARLVTLEFTVSFKGREDFDLNKKLLAELSGIVNWALKGLQRLERNGQFTETTATKEMKDDFDQLNNPLFGFVKNVIVEDSNCSESKHDVYQRWLTFRAENEIIPGGSKQQFGRMLKAAIPSIKEDKKKVGNKRVPAYKNIRIVHGVYIASMRVFWESMVEHMESVR